MTNGYTSPINPSSYQTPTPMQQPVYTQGAAQTEPQVEDQNRGGKKKMVIILIIIALIAFCCIASASAGAIYYLTDRKTDDDTTTAETTEETTSEDSTTDTTIDTTTSGQTPTSSPTTSATSSTAPANQPSIQTVSNNMLAAGSYRIEGSSSNISEVNEGAYVSPDKEYMKTTQGGDIKEEIVIGSSVYYRENNGAWQVKSTPSLANFHELLATMFLDPTVTVDLKGDKQGYWWYYVDLGSGGEVDLLVNKSNGLYHSITVSVQGTGSGTITYSDYNDSSISIQAPI